MTNPTRLAVITALFLGTLTVAAQQRADAGFSDRKGPLNTLDVAVLYSTLHTNAPVGFCDCFWMNGGTAEVAIPISRYYSFLLEIGGEHSSTMANFNTSLDLFTGAAGIRARWPTRKIWQPYGQAMVGGDHGFNSLFPVSQTDLNKGKLPTSDDTSFLMILGGGVDISVSRHFWIRPAQVEYHYSELRNLQGDRQNQLRLSAGIVWRR